MEGRMQVLEPTSTGPDSLLPWDITAPMPAEEYAGMEVPQEPETIPILSETPAVEVFSVLRIVVPESAPASPAIVEPSGRIKLENEEFRIEWDDEEVRIIHDHWSLCGFGETLFEAQLDLVDEARELGSVMTDMDVRALSEQARRLRTFALRFLTTTSRHAQPSI